MKILIIKVVSHQNCLIYFTITALFLSVKKIKFYCSNANNKTFQVNVMYVLYIIHSNYYKYLSTFWVISGIWSLIILSKTLWTIFCLLKIEKTIKKYFCSIQQFPQCISQVRKSFRTQFQFTYYNDILKFVLNMHGLQSQPYNRQ
jgi:hypothetical protein